VPEVRVTDLGLVEAEPPIWRPLTKARRIVSVGRALKDAETFALAQQLAAKLGAELGGDRSAFDCGWIDEAHLVSVTGTEVAPDLYIALGILGDTIHNAAIVGAKCVLAVHPNPEAPIFRAADYAVAADPRAVLAALVNAVE
jgi:electron transfer flavoprotein alpha subunit